MDHANGETLCLLPQLSPPVPLLRKIQDDDSVSGADQRLCSSEVKAQSARTKMGAGKKSEGATRSGRV